MLIDLSAKMATVYVHGIHDRRFRSEEVNRLKHEGRGVVTSCTGARVCTIHKPEKYRVCESASIRPMDGFIEESLD